MVPASHPSSPATRTGITTDRLSVSFGGVTALDQVSIEIPGGSSAAVIGPNGSGKSTFLNVVAGLVRPSAGAVSVDRSRVAYVLQRHDHRRWMPITVREILEIGRSPEVGLLRRLRRVDHDAVARAAERLEITALLDRQFSELSGGQRQRVLVAQALTRDPSVLLLDEPITGLDLASQERILSLITEETAAGHTVVISTHHLDEARHCDLVVLLARRLVAVGPPDTVLTPDLLRVAYAGRVLGDHHDHGHRQDLLMLDDHGHEHA